jgi:hypothetical protein
MKKSIYLDDIRTPIKGDWILVRTYNEFVKAVEEIGLENIDTISLDHDLGDDAINEYLYNTVTSYKIDYDNISEKTGYDCAKWLIGYFYTTSPNRSEMRRSDKKQTPINFPKVYTHSANPIGSANIMGYINNFLANETKEQTCTRISIEHTISNSIEINNQY